jgi:hypothetical protein
MFTWVLYENLYWHWIVNLLASQGPHHNVVSAPGVPCELAAAGHKPIARLPIDQPAVEVLEAIGILSRDREIADRILNLFQNAWGIFLASWRWKKSFNYFSGRFEQHGLDTYQ